ncbi:MAG: T9SS type A sorting domain-containing protein [Flavobacteriales bacterium]
MKTLLLPITALLFSVSTFAQLYVKPTDGGAASYIYVNDEVLFVNDNITLTKNDDVSSTEKASIYLREGSQLIQGDDTASNDGTGYISIYQNTPDSDAWDYTFWSSPVGDQGISGSGNKNFGALRIFDVDGLTASTVNQPISASNGEYDPEMKISRRWLYTYGGGTGWQGINDNAAVPPGQGFTMKGLGTTNHDQLYDFRGRPNNGTITTPIVSSAFILSGNPYPSALDLNKVFWENDKIDTFYFWDENHDINGHTYIVNQGGYGTWTPGGTEYDATGTNAGIYVVAPFYSYNNSGTSTGTTNGSGLSYERRFAPVGQGFMLGGKEVGGTGTVTYNNSQRVYVKEGANSQFRGPVGNIIGPDVITADYRLPQLRFNTHFNETHMRQLVLAFSDDATDGFDRGFDARSAMDSTSDAFFPIDVTGDGDNRPHVIQGVNFERYKHIPYTLTLDVRAQVVVNVIEKVKFNEYSVYLYDNVEDTYQEIKGEDELSVELELPAGLYEDRFFIAFVDGNRMQQLANEEIKDKVLEDVDFFQNNPAKQLEIANPEGYDIASANIFDMSGKLVYMASNLGNNSRFTFPTGNLSDGIYLVMLTTTENIPVNYKITVKNR